MVNLSLKIASALVLAILSVQAAPSAKRQFPGTACDQNVHSGNVDINSFTNIVPVTDVTPITRFQPIVKTFAPLVDSECANQWPGIYGYRSGFSGLGRGVPGMGSPLGGRFAK
ncbi:hypothetical protein BGZ65_011756, partial [Modicella reniformis]